ncbi:MAG TPA: XdhC family protein [Streptosporangiaceae bacterium]|nr:XdhC family protein [Streptosporangiaceae bacterium]
MEGWKVIEHASELARRGEAFALATVVWRQGPSSGQLGSRAIITASGELHGWIGGACAEPSVLRQAQQVIAAGKPRLLLLGTPEQLAETLRLGGAEGDAAQAGGTVKEGIAVVPISCQSEGALEVYIEPVLPAPHLVVVGSSPMARTLTGMAQALGWNTALYDWPAFSAELASERSMIVVATQGHGDEEAIEQAVAARPAYLGLVGSRKRGTAVLGYLAERGVAAEQLDRVKVPAGLDLGRTSHVEVAVAILAELVRLRASGDLPASAPAQAGAGHAETAQAAASAEAIDPVCGMTVTVGPAGRPLEHDGVTYYFCCAGCRSAFESSPASYAKKETRC